MRRWCLEVEIVVGAVIDAASEAELTVSARDVYEDRILRQAVLIGKCAFCQFAEVQARDALPKRGCYQRRSPYRSVVIAAKTDLA